MEGGEWIQFHTVFFCASYEIYRNFFRRLKGPGIPTTILKCATGICNVYVVSRDEIINKPADTPSANGEFEVHAILGNNFSCC